MVTRRCVAYSHASGKVVAGLVKFYREIFYKRRFFKHIETAASEITKKQPVIFNTVAGRRTPLHIL